MNFTTKAKDAPQASPVPYNIIKEQGEQEAKKCVTIWRAKVGNLFTDEQWAMMESVYLTGFLKCSNVLTSQGYIRYTFPIEGGGNDKEQSIAEGVDTTS